LRREDLNRGSWGPSYELFVDLLGEVLFCLEIPNRFITGAEKVGA
jgi:hypothetical protein